MGDPPSRRNIKLVVAYNGAAYSGWQRQAAGIDTVQQRLEEAAGDVLRHKVIVFGAGRTDAGVHALGQVANFHTTNFAVPLRGLRRATNSRLNDDIVVRSVVEVPDGFHASRSASGKTYRYRIHTGPSKRADLRGQVWHFWRGLDIDAMRDAAWRLKGRHDFRGFTISAEKRQDTVRTIHRCDVAEIDDEALVTVRGSGFLYNMVRIIVGTLVEIGRGHWGPDRIDRILASRDRAQAGPTAPPDGLYLQCVFYPREALRMDAQPARAPNALT
jgi:tRNA pseudouridine38-40 synthase